MPFTVVRPDDFAWTTRPHEPGAPTRQVAEISDAAGLARSRANVWRYEPGAQGRRHRHPVQEETFVVLAGALTMYLGDAEERVDVPAGGLINVAPQTPLQIANHGDDTLLLYIHAAPPEDRHAEMLDSTL